MKRKYTIAECDGSDFSQTINDHKYFKSYGETLAYGLRAGVDCFTDNGELVYAAVESALYLREK